LDHIIFRTDDPTLDEAGFILAEIDEVRSSNLNSKDEGAILGGTALGCSRRNMHRNF